MDLTNTTWGADVAVAYVYSGPCRLMVSLFLYGTLRPLNDTPKDKSLRQLRTPVDQIMPFLVDNVVDTSHNEDEGSDQLNNVYHPDNGFYHTNLQKNTIQLKYNKFLVVWK